MTNITVLLHLDHAICYMRYRLATERCRGRRRAIIRGGLICRCRFKFSRIITDDSFKVGSLLRGRRSIRAVQGRYRTVQDGRLLVQVTRRIVLKVGPFFGCTLHFASFRGRNTQPFLRGPLGWVLGFVYYSTMFDYLLILISTLYRCSFAWH